MQRHDYSSSDYNAALSRQRANSKAAFSAMDKTIAALEDQAKATVTYLRPRDGVVPPADRIVLDCLRQLQAIPKVDRQGADRLMDGIALTYQLTARNSDERMRRCMALLVVCGEEEI